MELLNILIFFRIFSAGCFELESTYDILRACVRACVWVYECACNGYVCAHQVRSFRIIFNINGLQYGMNNNNSRHNNMKRRHTFTGTKENTRKRNVTVMHVNALYSVNEHTLAHSHALDSIRVRTRMSSTLYVVIDFVFSSFFPLRFHTDTPHIHAYINTQIHDFLFSPHCFSAFYFFSSLDWHYFPNSLFFLFV